MLFEEGVEIVLASRLVVFPGRAAEDTAPVCRCAAVLLRIRPDVPVALIIVLAGSGFFEPFVLVRSVVEHQIHDDADTALARLFDQPVHILHRPISRIDAIVVSDVVSVVCLRRSIAWCKPHRSHAKTLQVIQLRSDPVDITDPVSV